MTSIKYLIGRSNGRWFLILIQLKRHNKSFLAKKRSKRKTARYIFYPKYCHVDKLLKITNTFTKANKNVGFLRNFQKFLPRISLCTIYKSFIRPLLDYGDVTYDQTYNISFQQKIEKMQYNGALAINATVRGTFKEKPY